MSPSEERAGDGDGADDRRDRGSQASEVGSGAPFTQQVGRVVVGVLALLFLVFAVYNRQDVTLDWLVATTETPLIVVLIGSFALGALVGSALLWRRHQRGRGRSGPHPDEDR